MNLRAARKPRQASCQEIFFPSSTRRGAYVMGHSENGTRFRASLTQISASISNPFDTKFISFQTDMAISFAPVYESV